MRWGPNLAYGPGVPAPEFILSSSVTWYQDTLVLDTTYIDTVWVEKMDGSNCHYAADGFCDTSPDYIDYRWPCNDNLESNVTQMDPNGETFQSDGSLFMSR